eukprot:GHVU01021250.1.p1 GENE.GHVU01021250.1~~GHVU01021250.1.p1  ORF type:complete len:117 (-),score=7.20 GHVU01021250.1:40-390(-)
MTEGDKHGHCQLKADGVARNLNLSRPSLQTDPSLVSFHPFKGEKLLQLLMPHGFVSAETDLFFAVLFFAVLFRLDRKYSPLLHVRFLKMSMNILKIASRCWGFRPEHEVGSNSHAH